MNGWKEWFDLHGEHELESWDDVWQMVAAQMPDDDVEEEEEAPAPPPDIPF